MTGPHAAPSVRPLEAGRAPRRWAIPLIAGIVGAAQLLAVLLLGSARWPAQVPSHFALGGSVDATSSPSALALGGVVVILSATIVLVALFYAAGRSRALEVRYGPTVLAPAAAWFALLLGLLVPMTFWGILLDSVGAWPRALPPSWLLAAVLEFLGVFVFLGVAAFRLSRGAPYPPATGGAPAGSGADRTGPVFQCLACGHAFVRSPLLLLAPRIGIGLVSGGASYYLRCPVCGERGWNPRIGWNSVPVVPAERAGATHR